MRRLFYIVLLFLALPLVAQEELCMDGTLLFREDFGGNDPSDPAVSSQNVPGMSSQYYNSGNSLGSGHYTVRKEGWSNGIQWHRQDDHTYPNDKTRGYLLEVDGIGGAEPFYSTTIDGLCAGSKLTFSAYVVNVHYAGQLDYFGGSYVYPRMKFVLKDPTTGSVLAEKSTGDIQPDWRYGTPETWKYARDNVLSAEWQLMGMNFTVPEGVESIQMYIYNDVARNGSGNDFALDDIEIHLCLPKPEIIGEPEVCENNASNLSAAITNDGTMAEPLEYKWWHSTDSVTWSEMAGMTNTLAFTTTQKADSGWYKVAVSGDGNIESVNCRAMSEPFRLKVNECAEELCIDGILLFREDFGGNDPNDPIVGTQHVPGMDYSRYTQRLNADHVTGQPGLFWLIKSGYYHADTTGGRDPMRNHSNWYLQDDHTYPNDKTRGYLLEIDGMGGTAPFYSTVVHGVCPGTRLTFSAYVANVNKASNYIDGVHARVYPKLKFEIEDAKTHTVLGSHSTGDIPYDPDLTVNTDFWYSSKWYLHGMTFTMPEAVDSIRLTIYNDVMYNGAGNDFALDDIEIRLCLTPDTIRTDTTVCDTLSRITWHGKEFAITDTLRDTLLSSCGFDSIYYELHVTTAPCEEELCMDGILLFREDFGGNDPSDPRVGTTPVSGMSYTQLTSDRFGVMGAGKYLVTKSGYCNGDTSVNNLPQNRRSQWHLQDDHTYPNDRTRGYLLEIDARADNAAFYQTTIEHLCEGIELTFSAYVANVMTWGQYMGRPGMYAYPRLKFVLTNPTNNSELATYDTGDIPFDSTFINDYTCWLQSAQWQLVGMNFTVPVGVEAIQLSIYNNVDNAIGNDFALDDIEIHLCMTPDTIRTDTTVCDTLSRIAWRGKEFALADTLRDTLLSSCGFDSIYYELRVSTEHCCQSSNGLHGFSVSASRQVLFAPGNLQYNPAQGSHLCADGSIQQGTWRFAEHQWTGIGETSRNISDTYDGWIDLFSWGTSGWNSGANAYLPWSRSTDENDYWVGGNVRNSLIGTYKYADWAVYNSIGNDTPEIWRTLTAEEWEYILDKRDNAAKLCGKASIDNIHGMIFLPDDFSPTTISSIVFIPGKNKAYETNIYTISQWEKLESIGAVFLPAVGLNNLGFNRVGYYWSTSSNGKSSFSNAGVLQFSDGSSPIDAVIYVDRPPRCSVRPVWDIPKDYIPSMEVDTTICDTLLPFTWMGIEWKKANVILDTLQSVCGADSICLILSLQTENCCPEGIMLTFDTLVCDTLLPFTWTIGAQSFVFQKAETQHLDIPHPKWTMCTDIIYVVRLDTFHCERLYPIIVNKYNRQLLCDNVALRNFFPERTATAFQWYKNEQPISGATEDDYAEQNELCGVFQLNVKLDDGRSIWSNIIEIKAKDEIPIRVQIYNSQGMPVSEEQLSQGVYLYRYERGEEVWIEKKWIP